MTAVVLWVFFWIAMTVVCGCSAKKMAKRHQSAVTTGEDDDDDALVSFDEDAKVFDV